MRHFAVAPGFEGKVFEKALGERNGEEELNLQIRLHVRKKAKESGRRYE